MAATTPAPEGGAGSIIAVLAIAIVVAGLVYLCAAEPVPLDGTGCQAPSLYQRHEPLH